MFYFSTLQVSGASSLETVITCAILGPHSASSNSQKAAMIPTWRLTLFPISSGVLYTKNQISVLLLVATTFHLFLLRGLFPCKGSMAISHHSLKKKSQKPKKEQEPSYSFIYSRSTRGFSLLITLYY